jgi:lambda repressor-like predicted transcriptional regulator
MNPPVLGLELLDRLETMKADLGLRLRTSTDDSPTWNESVWSYAVEFYRLFFNHYRTFPDFSHNAVDAARHNAVITTLEVVGKQIYNYNSLRPAYEKRIYEVVSDHVQRESRLPLGLSTRIVFTPVAQPRSPSLGIPALKVPYSDPIAEKRRALIQPILDAKGWSIYDWAQSASVSHHTANSYLNNLRKTYPYNRAKLAKALGLINQQLT